MPQATLDVASLIRTGDLTHLREQLVQWRPRQLAEMLAGLRADDQVIAFRILPRRLAAAVSSTLSEFMSNDNIGRIMATAKDVEVH
jgi:Mg/Co/Ni transporter MgtE